MQQMYDTGDGGNQTMTREKSPTPKTPYTIRDFITHYGTNGFDLIFSYILDALSDSTSSDEKLEELGSEILSDLREALHTEATK